ncbi:hypothetical protein KIS1582_3548 [Cytobacillus firmus]|uniref:Uncharacterized protein n=1 Tax=Cytobacillus firmus TaxID=1399 RepID=A0A800N9K7_CYTFI|nr:hypothetical protein KIS1582_3548 [Cytobacillus firmus]
MLAYQNPFCYTFIRKINNYGIVYTFLNKKERKTGRGITGYLLRL